METYSSILAWKIPWTEEPGRLQFIGSQRVRHDWVTSLLSMATSRRAHCCSSVTQSCPTLCHPMDCSIPGFPVLHYLLEFAETHGHWVGDAIQTSHPLLSPSPPAFSLSQHLTWPKELIPISFPQYYGHQWFCPCGVLQPKAIYHLLNPGVHKKKSKATTVWLFSVL